MRPIGTPMMSPMATAMSPICKEMRAPYNNRENKSRPSSSVPSQWSDDGPWRARKKSASPGGWVATKGAAIATARKRPMMMRPNSAAGRRANRPQRTSAGPRPLPPPPFATRAVPCSPITNPRIDDRVQQIHNQIDDDKPERDDQNRRLYDRVVPYEDRVNQITPQSRPGENGFGQHRAAEQCAKLEPLHGDDRHERVAERVAIRDEPLAQPLCSSGANVVMPGNFQHRGAGHARDDRGRI